MSDVDSIRLLVIDDDPNAFTMVQHMLATVAQPHISVAWVGTYQEGLAALKNNQHDIYLVDYLLGDEGGVDLLESAHAMGVDAPVILLTAYGTYEIDVQAMQLGAMDYLDKKKITPDLLERSIRYALERKRTERELKRLHRQIAGLEQLKTDMIRIAAHDLKNPLASMKMSTRIMRHAIAHNNLDKLSELADTIDCDTRRMTNLVTNILSLERIEEIHTNTLHKIELNTIIQSIGETFIEQATTHGLTFTMHLPDIPLFVYGDKSLLAQAFSNLVSNAIKYTPAGGKIVIELSKDKQEAVIEVADTGQGIEKQYHDTLFQPFMRIDSPEGQNNVEGTGLGLYLVKSIVTRHSGTMEFCSEAGRGSTFGFRLPLCPEPK